MRIACIFAFLLATMATQVRADLFVMADGTTIEGTIVEEAEGEITVQSKYGKFKLKRADISEIRKQETTREAFAKKKTDLESGPRKSEAGAWVELGFVAKKAGFQDEFRAAMQQALKLDSENLAARQALGMERNANNPPQAQAPDRVAGKEAPKTAGQPSDAMTPLTQKVEAHDCTTCGGYGVLKNLPGKYKGFPCMTCNGKGKLEKLVTYDGCEVPKGNHVCTLCDGKKFGTWKPCEKCGSGEMPGLIKRMSGYYLCESCKGMAELPGLPCRECKGVGYVKD